MYIIHLVLHVDVYTYRYENEISKDSTFQLCHTFSEGNIYTDFLAKPKNKIYE